MDPVPRCLKTDAPGATALAALATVGIHHDLPLDAGSLRKLSGLTGSTIDGVMLLYAAGLCGFDALPFEVDYDQLPLVALPAILLLRDDTYRVLYEVEDLCVTAGNPLSGDIQQLSSADLQTLWTGDVYQLQPNEQLAAARQTLRRIQSPAYRAAALAGIVPTSGSRLLFTLATIDWIAALFVLPLLTLLIGACVLTSLWMLAFPHGCQKCGATKSLSGDLSLPALGAAFYALLAAATVFAPPPLLLAGLFAATGAHLALVGILIRKRIACHACLGTALLAWTATALGLWRHQLTAGMGWETAALPATAVVMLLALHLATKLAQARSATAAISFAFRVTSEKPPQPGTARLVVYSRERCPICAYAKGIILPSLAEEFGEALAIELRDAAHLKLAVPLFFVTGGSARLGLASVATDEMMPRLVAAIRLVLAPAAGPFVDVPGLYLSGFEDAFADSQK